MIYGAEKIIWVFMIFNRSHWPKGLFEKSGTIGEA